MPVRNPSQTSPSQTSLAPELVAAAREDGEQAAERVVSYIRAAVANGAPVPKPLTAEWLRNSAEANSAAWNRNGLGLDRELGEVVADSPTFVDRVLDLFINRTAWSARQHLNVDVSIDLPNDDAFLDYLARLMWDNRHVVPANPPHESATLHPQ